GGFVEAVTNYANGRDHPARAEASALSPHLPWGEISPRPVWDSVRDFGQAPTGGPQAVPKGLGGRELCHLPLVDHPCLPRQPFAKRFADFPWVKNHAAFDAWSKGMTGIPIVDAGMRQLWRTGWMHNRVRMIAASLLIKHIGIDWRHGQDWFWDTLVDADLANN